MLEYHCNLPVQPIDALKPFERLIGTWAVSDPSGASAVSGETTYEWMGGGSFVLQRMSFGDNRGIEIIGYDDDSGTLKSHYYGMDGKVLEYEYEMDADTLIISIDTPQTQGDFVATFSADGSRYSGSWEWSQDGVPMGYDALMTRVS